MPHGHGWVFSEDILFHLKVEDWGYGCRMDALSSFTLFIGHTHVPSGFFPSMSCGDSACMWECVRVILRFVHFPASADHKSLDGTQEHHGNCAITQCEGGGIQSSGLHLCLLYNTK